jgi:hypothetical protein
VDRIRFHSRGALEDIVRHLELEAVPGREHARRKALARRVQHPGLQVATELGE